MTTSFDTHAPTYDAQFTHGLTGSVQRKQIWDYLASEPWFQEARSILDIHCGTGEDALWLASQGHIVTATDVSESMLTNARSKDRTGLTAPPQFLKHDLLETEWGWPENSFDAVLSNFAGLNCVDPGAMNVVAANIYRILRPGGRFVVVLFGKYCFISSSLARIAV